VSKPNVLFSAIVANLYTGVIIGVYVKGGIYSDCVLLWPLFSRCLFHELKEHNQKVIKIRKKINSIFNS
jgi:hypothetical protein